MKNSAYYFLHDILLKNEIKFNKKIVKNIKIKTISDISRAKKNYISFFSNINYLQYLKKTKASAIIIEDKFIRYMPKGIIPIVSQNPTLDFYKILNFFYPNCYFSKISYDYLSVETIKKKYKNLKFGINFYLEQNVKIGKNVFIGNNVVIKKDCFIGNNVIIGSNVVIEHSHISDNVHICDGSILGKKGFGFKFIKNKCYRLPHIGKVIVGKGCEIGANCVIDRGSVSDTIIGDNSFLDNFVHIAHNVSIGKNCIFAAQVGVAGSTKIGNNVVIGGQAGIAGHLSIGNNVRIGGKSGVTKSIKDNKTVMGYPAKSFREFVKINKV